MKVKLLHPDAIAPTRGSDGAAGYDLYAHDGMDYWWGKVQKINTGVCVEIPPGYVGLIRDRSSFAQKDFFVVGGVVDSDYRGEVSVLFAGSMTLGKITKGTRCAQLVIVPCLQEPIEIVSELSPTTRDAGGFGSTGA